MPRERTPQQCPDDSKFTLQRREFLLLGSVAAVGLTATGLPAGIVRTLSGEGTAPTLSVGYSRAENLDHDSPVIAAHNLGHDVRFGGATARVTVHGFWPGSRRAGQPVSVALHAYYPTGKDKASFIGWTSTRTKQTMLASRGRFEVPVVAGGALDLSIERSTPRALPAAGRVVRRPADLLALARETKGDVPSPLTAERVVSGALLTLGSGRDAAAGLRQGTYFVAIADEGQRVDWNGVRYVPGAGVDARGSGVLQNVFGDVPFDYLMLTIERV